MKNIIIYTLLLTLSTTLFSQQPNPTQALVKTDYIQKSKHQKKIAWILAGGGLVLEISGVIAYQHGPGGLLLLGVGLLSQAISIPFFISSIINKRKANKASLSFKFERNQNTQLTKLGHPPVPSLILKLDL